MATSQQTGGMSTAQKNRLPDSRFAFPSERKEPLTDAAHVRNAVARFDQVEGVTDAERDRAWRRIRAAARKYGVEISARGWRELVRNNTQGDALPRGCAGCLVATGRSVLRVSLHGRLAVGRREQEGRDDEC